MSKIAVKKRHESVEDYSFDEYMKKFAPELLDQKKDESDDPQAIGKKLAHQTLDTLQKAIREMMRSRSDK